jgi:uncharacterized protein YifE (UPF0438 family)
MTHNSVMLVDIHGHRIVENKSGKVNKMIDDERDSPESFEKWGGFTRQQAEHLSRLSISMNSMIRNKQSSTTKDMFEFYEKKADALHDEIEFYWKKYEEENYSEND